MKIDYMAIGMRIRRIRKEKGLTQANLAELSEQEPSNISHIERGATKLSLPTIVNIANALGTTVDCLLCDSIIESEDSYIKLAGEILSDCNHYEMRVLTETMLALKEIIKKVGRS